MSANYFMKNLCPMNFLHFPPSIVQYMSIYAENLHTDKLSGNLPVTVGGHGMSVYCKNFSLILYIFLTFFIIISFFFP